jgi:hypothetical protein
MKFRAESLPLLFLLTRVVLFLSIPYEGLTGYGDLIPFYNLVSLAGWPLFDYWIEFPPLFPWAAELLFRLFPRQAAFANLLALIFSLAQAGGLAIFIKLANEIWGEQAGQRRSLAYFALTVALFFGWTYMDGLVLTLTLAGIYAATRHETGRAGLLLALGALTKWFSLLALPALWRFRRDPPERQRALRRLSIGVLAAVGMVWGLLFLASPELSLASLRSQGSKGSWETVWALVDGNLGTGNFGPLDERFDPAAASQSRGNPATIPTWLTLLTFGAIGAFLFFQADLRSLRQLLAFVGLTIVLFFLWSPGWSPQWILVLVPFTLLALPEKRSLLFALLLVLVSLVEWPLLLSRGLFDLIWIPIVLRTFLFLLLLVDYWPVVSSKSDTTYA